MKLRISATPILVTALIGTMALAPMSSFASGWHRDSGARDQWKGIGIVAGIAGILGLASHNDIVAAIGLAGAAYSAYRYSSDDGHRFHDWDDRGYGFGGSVDWNRGRGDWSRGRRVDWGRYNRTWSRGRHNGW